jgi:hypothetical protein
MVIEKITRRLKSWRRAVSRRIWLWSHGPAERSQTVFILGAQRSGTTMLAGCFEESAQFDVYGELSVAFQNSILKDFSTVRQLISQSPRPFVAFKPLTDSHRAGELLSIDRGAKAIWMYRRPEDRANSAVNRFGDTNLRFLRELEAVGPTDRWEARGVSENTLSIVRRLDPASMDMYAAAATFWFLRNQLFFEQRLDKNPNVLLLKYEELVTNAEVTMKRMCAFVGCDFNPAMIRNIHTGSIGRSSIKLPRLISQTCEEMLEKLDECWTKQWGTPVG